MDLRQTKEYGEYLKQQGWIIEEIQNSNFKHQINVFIRRLPWIPFSVMKMQRFTGEINWEKLNQIKSKHKVIFSVLEPLEKIKMPNYKLSASPYLPTKTLVIDLGKSEEVLLKEMSKDARQKIKKTIRLYDCTNLEREKIREFWGEWKRCKKGYVPSLKALRNLKNSFGERAWFLIVEGKAGVIILLSDDTAYYYFAWTNNEGRKAGVQYKLVWEAIKKAKKMGLKKFDFEGIYDERWPLKSWQGFSAFKKKFGGEAIEYPGSWQRWL